MPTALLTLLLAVAGDPAPPWEATHACIAGDRDALAREAAAALAALRERVEDDPLLRARLEPPPPAALASGYGILPRVDPDPPPAAGVPRETRYALPDLAAWVERERRGVAALLAATGAGRPAAALVDDYRRLAGSLRRIDDHLSYHAFWQAAAERGALARDGDGAGEGGFVPASRLAASRDRDGTCLLQVPIATDLEDDSFLALLADAVEREWNRAPPMRAAGLRLRLAWQRRRADELYPEGPPPPGTALDLAAHRRRFGAGAYVLTTGAASTHAEGGALALGPAPLTPRLLAHEVGHFIGFNDGYRRGFAGEPGDAAGVVVIETVSRPESLMASPGHGQVTATMVEMLRAAYFP